MSRRDVLVLLGDAAAKAERAYEAVVLDHPDVADAWVGRAMADLAEARQALEHGGDR